MDRDRLAADVDRRLRDGHEADVVAPALLLAELLTVVFRNRSALAAARGPGTDLPSLAEMLLSTYLVPFEVASVLLLAVLVGAIAIARRKVLHDPR